MKVVIPLLITVASVLLYVLAGIYLQRVSKGGLQSAISMVALGLGGLGALFLIVTACIPNSMPSAFAFLLLAIPLLTAAIVFIIRAGTKLTDSKPKLDSEPKKA